MQAVSISSSVAVSLAIRRLFLMLSWKSWVSCVTKLSRSRRFLVLISSTDRPESSTLPSCTFQNRIRSFNRVDFPLPLLPTIPTTAFSGIVTDTSERMVSFP